MADPKTSAGTQWNSDNADSTLRNKPNFKMYVLPAKVWIKL